MSAIAFDTLKFVRRLVEAGVPEKQAEVQAELMAEAFVYNMDSLVTRDYLGARLDARFTEQYARIDARFAEQYARIDARFAEQDAKNEARFAEQVVKNEARFAGMNALFDGFKAMFVEQNASNDVRFAEIQGELRLHRWILGAIAVSTVLPFLRSLFSF